MTYLVNPGDGRDVLTFDSQDAAYAAYNRAQYERRRFAAIYRVTRSGAYERFTLYELVGGVFCVLDDEALVMRVPLKVLEAAKKLR